MYKNEIKRKFNIIKGELLPFGLSMIARDKLIVSGIKGILASNQTQIRLRLQGEILQISGEDFSIVEIGGGDVYIKGIVKAVEFE